MRVAGQHILLLVGNVSSQRMDESLLHVKIQQQPLDVVISARLNPRLPKFSIVILLTALSILSSNFQLSLRGKKKMKLSLFLMLMSAMQLAASTWLTVTRTIIAHCWIHTHTYWMSTWHDELVESFHKLRTSALTQIHSGLDLFHLWRQEQNYTSVFLCRCLSQYVTSKIGTNPYVFWRVTQIIRI